jgi:hypothetical protein
MSIHEEIQRVIAAPDTSHWLRDALIAASLRDPVDAANDAEVLSDLMSRRCAQLLGRGGLNLQQSCCFSPFWWRLRMGPYRNHQGAFSCPRFLAARPPAPVISQT